MNLRSIIRYLIESSLVLKTGRYLYHSSNPVNRDIIDKEGLRPMRGDQWLESTAIDGPAIFATDSENKEDYYDSTYDDDFWRIDTYKCPDVEWKRDPNFAWDPNFKHIYAQQPIPRVALKLIHKGTGEDRM